MKKDELRLQPLTSLLLESAGGGGGMIERKSESFAISKSYVRFNMAFSTRPASSSSSAHREYNSGLSTTAAILPGLFNYSLAEQQNRTIGPITTSSSSPRYYHVAKKTGQPRMGKSPEEFQLREVPQLPLPLYPPESVIPGLSTEWSHATSFQQQPLPQTRGHPSPQNTSVLSPSQAQSIYFINNEIKNKNTENVTPLNENQLAYLQQIQSIYQRQEAAGPIARPWWIWGIGCVDLASAVWYTVYVIYNIVSKPISDPENYIWKFFIGFLAILGRILQGIGLIIGLKSDDDSSTLWYCKVWFACQLVFVTWSVLEVLFKIVFYGVNPIEDEEYPPVILRVVGVFVYRIVTFILMRIYIGKLKLSENRYLTGLREGLEESRRDQQRAEEERFGTGESSFCGPSIALIMSL